jgi:hypothetical protein
MAIKSRRDKENSHKKLDTRARDSNNSFFKKYPGFVAAVVIALIILAIFIWLQTAQTPQIQGQSMVAKNIFENNQAVLDQYILSVSEYSNGPFELTIDDDYYHSIMDDLNWLKKKELGVFYSRPVEDVYVKEAAFKYFMDKVVEANDYFTSGPEAADYPPIIAGSLAAKPLSLSSFSEFETAFYGAVDENTFNTLMLESESNKAKFFGEFNSLFENYYSEKKILIQNSASRERSYVEAKKLLLLSYSQNADGNFSSD